MLPPNTLGLTQHFSVDDLLCQMSEDKYGGEMDAPNLLPAEHHLSSNVLLMDMRQRLNVKMQTIGVTVRQQELCLYLSLPSYPQA